ncbi:MAG: hypothetical protein KAI66_26235, partial [Lentisphaeria bacterium]|nr:hypothetical protein [Lentisphaeria bacterium]
DTHYVDVNSTTPSAPYTNWVAAATNIQEAVDEAVDGDTVQVADGTYLISAEILVDKGVTVQSVSDETNTIVDAQELCRCFYLDHADAVIEGFTISNGKVTGAGGGVYCSNGTVRNCTIDGNTALEGMDDSSWWGDKAGGGICCDNGLIDACTISNNEATSSLGGGVYLRADAELRDSTVRDNTLLGSGGRARGGGVFSAGGVITGCVIENNIVQGASSGESVQGGGVFQVSSATLSESIIRGNEAIPGYTAGGNSGDGAGILALGSSIVEDCIIEGNIAHSGSGGGISTDTFLDSGTYLGAVRRCHFRLNIAGIEGGAFYSESANSVLRNCLIENNYAAYGGGVKTSGTVESCTIVSNTAVANGGGIITRGPLHNTIIYHNEAGAGRNHWIEEEEPDVTFCCTFPSIPGTGNFASDPLFIDLANGDFRLSPSSPCVNVGTNQDWMTGALDFYEENRIEHSDVDIGAAELQADTPLCDFAVDVRSGFIPMSVTFTAALNNIPTADLLYQWDFDNDGTIDEEGVGLSNVAHVYTASGAYSPALTVSSVAAGMHSKVREAFIMAGSENLYVSSGGSNTPPYASWGEAAHSISDALNAAPDGATIHIASGTYETTDQLVLDRPVTLRGVDGYETTILSGADTHHLFYLEHPDAVIEGLALINGRATLGGGLVIYGGGIARQCRIAECTASAWGGGVYSTGRASLLQDCVIEDNYAPYGGGGVWSGGGDLFEDCMIRSNSLSSQRGRFGAGVDSWGGTFLNCDISENTGSYGGAGIAMLGDTLIDGCTISNNSGTAAFSGGIMMWDGIVRNSDIRGNHGYWTGGVTMYGPGLVENCRIFDNENGGVIFDREGGTVRNCAIYQNHGRRGVILDDIGLLENCSVFNNDGGGVAAMQSGHSQPGRQAVVRNCIIWHNEASISPDLYLPDESTAGDPILENICTSEPPPTGPGHVIASPEFVDWENGDFGLLLSSPCIDAGVNQPWMDGFFVTDIDGNVRVQNGTVDIGAFETMSAVLECDLSCRQSVGTAPYTASFVSHVNGSNLIDLYYEWDFDGDGNVDAEGFGLGEVQWNYTSTGEYTVILTVTNGALETATVTKTNYVAVTPDYGAGYLYVDLDGTHSSPFSSWESAARDIQSALDVAPEGATILVNQGEYVIEETITISKSAVVQGIRGAALTTLDAEENCRVLSLSHADAEVVGFTIRRGRAGQGGGVYFSGGGLVSDCILRENEATGYTDAGGAAFLNNGGTLDRCLIENNWAKGEGGGVQIDVDGVVKNCLIRGNVSTAYWAGGGGIYMEDGGAAYNCTVVDNETSEDGGGICIDSWGSGGIARNCIVWNNTASGNGDNAYGHSSRFEYCCIEGYTADGTGNTTNAPAFVDLEAGDYRLLPSSPCIDTGTNMDWMASATDLEGNPRINFGLVDMGTYEFSIPGYTVFDVESIHGTPEPPVGLNHLEIGSNIVCSVTDSPVTIGATQYVCTGWIGSGDVTSG